LRVRSGKCAKIYVTCVLPYSSHVELGV